MTRPTHACDKHPAPARACYVQCRCRCYGCTAANSDAERHRAKQKAYGRWQPYVDAELVRAHVRSLMAPKVGSTRGMGWKRIADAAGVPHSTLWKLLYGGRWCLPCFQSHSTGEKPTGCGTDAGYTRHRRAGETPCQACRDAHTLAHRLRQSA